MQCVRRHPPGSRPPPLRHPTSQVWEPITRTGGLIEHCHAPCMTSNIHTSPGLALSPHPIRLSGIFLALDFIRENQR